MAAPESTVEEVRTSVLRYMRMYEEGRLTLGDFAAEIAVMAPAYDHAMGGIEDHYGDLLGTAFQYARQSARDAGTSYSELERVLTEFRRKEAAW